MKKILNKKIHRLLTSKNAMRLFYLYHFIAGGFKSKKIDISFDGKKSRVEIVQNIIEKMPMGQLGHVRLGVRSP